MNTRVPLRSLRFSLFLGMTAFSLGGCILPGSVGEDPDSGDEDAGSTSSTSGGGSNGHTSANPSGTGGPGTTIPTVSVSVGEVDSGSPTTAGPLTEEEALDYCGVPEVEPPPEGPVYLEEVVCGEGCSVQVESAGGIDLIDYGECLCTAMDCGPFAGGTVGGPVDETDTDTDTDGEPDGCGPFPPGAETFTCTCEICSIDVNDVDATWLANEANLEGICACMCGNTGCGLPV